MKNARWKKQRGTDLPCLWDGESVWCFLMGPAEGGKRTCKLSAYPPQVVHTPRAVVFDLYVEDEADAKAKIWFWVENHPEWGLRMGANKVPDVDHHLEVVDYIVEILLAGCEDGS